MQLLMGWENDGMMWRGERERRENRKQKKKERIYLAWYSLRYECPTLLT